MGSELSTRSTRIFVRMPLDSLEEPGNMVRIVGMLEEFIGIELRREARPSG